MVIIILVFLLLATTGYAEVLFEETFDDLANWTVEQGIAGSSNCESDCGITGWDAYRNQGNLCSAGVTGRPGNNNIYINPVAGYPVGSETCRNSSAGCWTHWLEACLAFSQFDDADALFVKRVNADPDVEYEELYVGFYIRFKDNMDWDSTHTTSNAFKLWHIHHYTSGDSIWDFHSSNVNTPLAAGGIRSYNTAMYIYMDGICRVNLSCHGDVLFPIGTTTTVWQEGGLFDGNWHFIEIRTKRNSSVGVSDGLIEAWLDGDKLSYLEGYEGDDINFNDSGSLHGFNSVIIGGNNMSWLESGAACSTSMDDCEQWFSIDDVVISDAYIGPDYEIGGSAATISGCTISGGTVQ